MAVDDAIFAVGQGLLGYLRVAAKENKNFDGDDDDDAERRPFLGAREEGPAYLRIESLITGSGECLMEMPARRGKGKGVAQRNGIRYSLFKTITYSFRLSTRTQGSGLLSNSVDRALCYLLTFSISKVIGHRQGPHSKLAKI